MKRNLAVLAFAVVLAVVAGCQTNLPKPNSPKTAGVEALVAYGLAGHIAGQYLGLPECTSPLTVVPCKKADIAAKIKIADNTAYNAAVAADAAANDPVKVQNAAEKLDVLRQLNNEAKGGKQ